MIRVIIGSYLKHFGRLMIRASFRFGGPRVGGRGSKGTRGARKGSLPLSSAPKQSRSDITTDICPQCGHEHKPGTECWALAWVSCGGPVASSEKCTCVRAEEPEVIFTAEEKEMIRTSGRRHGKTTLARIEGAKDIAPGDIDKEYYCRSCGKVPATEVDFDAVLGEHVHPCQVGGTKVLIKKVEAVCRRGGG